MDLLSFLESLMEVVERHCFLFSSWRCFRFSVWLLSLEKKGYLLVMTVEWVHMYPFHILIERDPLSIFFLFL